MCYYFKPLFKRQNEIKRRFFKPVMMTASSSLLRRLTPQGVKFPSRSSDGHVKFPKYAMRTTVDGQSLTQHIHNFRI